MKKKSREFSRNENLAGLCSASERLEIWVFVVVIVELHIAGCVGRWASGEGCFFIVSGGVAAELLT